MQHKKDEYRWVSKQIRSWYKYQEKKNLGGFLLETVNFFTSISILFILHFYLNFFFTDFSVKIINSFQFSFSMYLTF